MNSNVPRTEVDLGVLLSFTTEVLFVDVDELYKFASWVYGDILSPDGLLAVADSIKRFILFQHPQLPTETEGVGRENRKMYLDAQKFRFGDKLLIVLDHRLLPGHPLCEAVRQI